MKLADLHVRDPYILPHDGTYYFLFSPGKYAWKGCDGFYITTSTDLEDWSEPVKVFTPPECFWGTKNFWAPELHYYQGAFYIFASFGAEGHKHASQILKSETPLGPYEPWSCPLTPSHKSCIDGTLYIENGKPYLVYSHEATDVENKIGSLWAVELSADLKVPVGEHRLLFDGAAPAWAQKKFLIKPDPFCVAEGPFFHRTTDGKLLMIWSSHSGPGCYVEAVSYTENGSLFGEWKHCDNLLVDKNGGHGMIFHTLDGELRLTYHYPNTPSGSERAFIRNLWEIKQDPFLGFKK